MIIIATEKKRNPLNDSLTINVGKIQQQRQLTVLQKTNMSKTIGEMNEMMYIRKCLRIGKKTKKLFFISMLPSFYSILTS